MKPLIAGAVGLCLVIIGIAAYTAVTLNTGDPRTLPIDPAYTQRVQKGYWAQGSANPKVTVVEYADFQCNGCEAMSPIITEAIADTKDIAQFQFKEFPLTQHAKAQEAARAAEAAGRQGKFWQMHDLLYAREADWQSLATTDFPSRLEQYASDIELNITQFNDDLNDPSIDDQITKDVNDGTTVSVPGIPTLLINGKLLSTLPTSTDALVQLIKQAASS